MPIAPTLNDRFGSKAVIRQAILGNKGLGVISGSALWPAAANKVDLISIRVADIGAIVVRAEVWAKTW